MEISPILHHNIQKEYIKKKNWGVHWIIFIENKHVTCERPGFRVSIISNSMEWLHHAHPSLSISHWFLSRSLQAKILTQQSVSKILPLQGHPMPSRLRNKLSWHDIPFSLSLSLWIVHLYFSPTWWTIHYSTQLLKNKMTEFDLQVMNII